jgi:YbgC/YbaW family acyl-CoA thioester hydrolase
MPRVQLELPEKILFETEIGVRVSDINYGGHVGNDSILTIMQEARVIFYRTLGFKDEVNIEGSVGQIVTDSIVQYKSESFLGDTLAIKISVSDFNKYGFDMYYQLNNKATGKEVARGKTGIVCFDYEKKKVASVPESLLAKLSS